MIDRIFVTDAAHDVAYTKQILIRHGGEWERIPDADWYRDHVEPDFHDPVGAGKRHLLLDVFPGSFLRKCPGTKGRICCNYWVIDQTTNCPFDCSYCFLQNYLNTRAIRFAVNVDDLWQELDNRFRSCGPIRVGTGELSDSLALEPLTGFGALLVRFAADYPNVTLELKTKSDAVDGLPEVHEMDGRFVVGWTLSPRRIVEREEIHTASLQERLDAMLRVSEKGYRVAVHLDPMILFPDAVTEYVQLMETVLEQHQQLAWLSMAGFRYETGLKRVLEKRFPDNGILEGEFSRCGDGKYRYLFSERVRLFRAVRQTVRRRSPGTPVYFCMEDRATWSCAFGSDSWKDELLASIMG